MNWIPIVVSAGAGALAALAFHLALRMSGRTEPRGWHKTAYVVLFVAVLSISRYTITPWAEQMYFAATLGERLAESNKVFAALQRHDSQTYGVIVEKARAALRKGARRSEVEAAIRSEFLSMIAKRLPVAEDRVVHGYMKANMQELRELHAGGDEACYTFLHPGTGRSFDISARVKRETLQGDLDGAAAVIQSAATSPQRVPTLAEVEPLFAPAVMAVATKYGPSAFDAMQQPQVTAGDKRQVCEITLALYDELFKMKPEEGGRVMRALVSQ